MAGLTLEHIGKRYPNGYEAVKDFNLDIADKEFVIFVGPSGCGKSATLRTVVDLETISSGTLRIDGTTMNDVEPKDRDIAMVFQNYALYPHMSVYDNMAFALKMQRAPKDEIDRKVREAAKILDLDLLLTRKPRALSGGQRQRVAMGRAIVRNPKVFLMDEPLSNLDAKLRVQMRAEISKLHDRLGATIIYVTHDQTEAMTLGTRIVVMKDGEIQQVDTPRRLYERPCNLFVAGFIGSPQMNFIDARVSMEPRGARLSFGRHAVLLDGRKAKAVEPYDGKVVELGVRPEDVHELGAPAEGKRLSEPFDAKVDVYELLGSVVMLHCDSDGSSISASVFPETTARTGSKVQLAFDLDKVHLFDKDREQAIAH